MTNGSTWLLSKIELDYREDLVNIGWPLSSDRNYIDDDSYYWFVRRDDDVINTGGHLVSPFEVESALLGYPSIAESTLIAKPDDTDGSCKNIYNTLKADLKILLS